MIVASSIYVLSMLVGMTCSFLLFKGHRRAPSRLLLSSAICFAGLALNDLGLLVDLFVLPDVDLAAVRSLPALAGFTVLVYALIKESR